MHPKELTLPPLHSIPKTQLPEPPSFSPPDPSTLLRPTSSRKAVSRHAQSISSLPRLPLPSAFPPDERVMDISKPTVVARREATKQIIKPQKTFDTTTLSQTIPIIESEAKSPPDELPQRKPKYRLKIHRSTQTPKVKRQQPNPESLTASSKKQQGESVAWNFDDIFAFRASLGAFLGVDERCVRICQNYREIATDPLSNRLFSSLERFPVEISLLSPYIDVTLVIPRNVNRYVKFGRFETLHSLKEKAAEIENTDVRCISFVGFWGPAIDDEEQNEQSDSESSVSQATTEQLAPESPISPALSEQPAPESSISPAPTEQPTPDSPISPALPARVEFIDMSDDVELDQLTIGTTISFLTHILPLMIEVTLRTNNNSTTMELNRFEKIEALIAPAAALLGKGKDDVTLWCDGVRVNPSLALDSLSANFTDLPLHITTEPARQVVRSVKSRSFWLPEAPARITLDVMGRDYNLGVVVVCGDEMTESAEVRSKTSGLQMKKLVGDWQQVDWHRIRLWKDELNEEEADERVSPTQRSKQTKQFMSEAGSVGNMTRTLNLTLHCQVAPASIKIVARTETTKHSVKVESWQRIGTVRKKIARKMGRKGAQLSLFLGEKELRDWHVVAGLTDEAEMEISVLDWPGMVLVRVQVDGKEEEHSMYALATLRSLAHRLMMSNRHLSTSSLTFTHNDTPLALSTRLISLGLSSSIVANSPPPPEQPPATTLDPGDPIATTLCGFRMDVDTVTEESIFPLMQFRGTVNFAHVNFINTKTGSLVPFNLMNNVWKPKAELSTPLTSSDLVVGNLNLRYELKPEFVEVRLTLKDHPIVIVHTSVLRSALSSRTALKRSLERQVVLEVKVLLGAEAFANRQRQQDENPHMADVWRWFKNEFSLPPLHFNSARLTKDTLSTLRRHTRIDLTCSVPSNTSFIIISHELKTHTFVVPSSLQTQTIFATLTTHCPILHPPDRDQPILFGNGRLFNRFSDHTIGTLFGSPIINVTVHNPHEIVLVNTISSTGQKGQIPLSLFKLEGMLSKCSFSRDLNTQSYIHYFALYNADEISRLGTRNALDIRIEWDGSVPTIRVVSSPSIDFRFFDANGTLQHFHFDRTRLVGNRFHSFSLSRNLTKMIESGSSLRYVDGHEEHSKAEGDDEWDDEGVIPDFRTNETSQEEEDDSEEDDGSNGEVTQDRHNTADEDDGSDHKDAQDSDNSADEHAMELFSEYHISSLHFIQDLFDEPRDNSDTDDSTSSDTDNTLSSERHEIVKRANRRRRRKIVSLYNRKNNTSLTPKYPLQPPCVTISMDLVKAKTICRLSGEMDATIECILHFVGPCSDMYRSYFNEPLRTRLAGFLSIPHSRLDVKVKKIRRTGQTQFESTSVESIEVVVDVEVRPKEVEVQQRPVQVCVKVVSGLMECGTMEGTLKEDHFSFSLPFSTSFLSLERLLREQLPQLGNLCWFAEPTTRSVDYVYSEDSYYKTPPDTPTTRSVDYVFSEDSYYKTPPDTPTTRSVDYVFSEDSYYKTPPDTPTTRSVDYVFSEDSYYKTPPDTPTTRSVDYVFSEDSYYKTPPDTPTAHSDDSDNNLEADDFDDSSSSDDSYDMLSLSQKMMSNHKAIHHPNMPIYPRNAFPSLPIRLTAVESLLPDSPTKLLFIDGERTAFVAHTHSFRHLVLVWPPTDAFTADNALHPDQLSPPLVFPPHSLFSSTFITNHPFLREKHVFCGSFTHPTSNTLDVASFFMTLHLRRVKKAEQTIQKSEQDNLSQSSASPNSQPDESTTPLRLWIETPMRRVMGLFAGSATVLDVLFFLGSLHCVCAPQSFHEHALFAGEEKLDGLVTVSEIIRTFGSVVSFRNPHID
ncbi:hypothetical protein BLNAU_8665 [Blattamonas nauphoetae]|uniref:Autophagy-related protein 2 n=1 Tax=Blattamonas nauphoetae TaxID=2049346 RepID=A0ABQ9XXS6_9EUKA|nr:hypothetical protein BLNAU_8665 [Blattamonas nauphoetae]